MADHETQSPASWTAQLLPASEADGLTGARLNLRFAAPEEISGAVWTRARDEAAQAVIEVREGPALAECDREFDRLLAEIAAVAAERLSRIAMLMVKRERLQALGGGVSGTTVRDWGAEHREEEGLGARD